jgi:hypothetical protein
VTLRATAKAIITRLEEDTILAGSTYQGVVLDRPNRYLSLFLNGGRREQGRFTGPSSLADYTLTTHSVGTTPEQAQFVEERSQAKLVDFTPVVPGFQCRRIQQTDSQPLQLDADTSSPLYFIASSYSLTMEAVN